MEAPHTYLCPQTPSTGVYKEKGSKFLAFVYPIENTEQVKENLQILKKKYFDASHHTYAYILGYKQEIFRINDDGEPSGTAGRPIYGQILSFGLTQTLLVVVRYFGGIKLGTSGLIKAYKLAAEDALKNANLIEKSILIPLQLRCPYEKLNQVMNVLKGIGAEDIKPEIAETCLIGAWVKKSQWDRIIKLSAEDGIVVL